MTGRNLRGGRGWAGRVLAWGAALLLAGCAALPGGPAGKEASIDYTLGSETEIRALYPDASWLPAPYAADYPDLAQTIALFTTQSLQREGVADAHVTVDFVGEGSAREVRVHLTPVNAITRSYASLHPRWLDRAHAAQALIGVAACKEDDGCWDPAPRQGQPWTAYLPLGLPMATQQTVLFLDYPPIPALSGKDYLNNFTMCRWGRVMGAAGADNVYAYETIVDARPIAAPGSGMDQYLPDPVKYFDDSTGTRGDYLTPMLELLTAREGGSRPVAVFGSAARKAWGQMVGAQSVRVLDTGTATLSKGAAPLPWIATNHPDVTTYNCCPGDGAKGCAGSEELLPDEQKDFVAACWLIEMAGHPGMSPDAAMQSCRGRWMDQPSAADQQSLCVQAKLDNNDPGAVCSSYTEAWNYCSAHAGNACATYDCKYDPAKVVQPAPPPAQRPAGWADTCNGFR